ncbi:MAG: zinc ribbon domain-containing protein [Clostridia bacterium]|nr:zinc ribbon domain-containing protein [Clostridia bacterium]
MKVCPNCQANFDDSLKFCLKCGTELVDAPAAAQPQPQAAPAAAQAQPEPQQAYAQPQQPYAQSQPAYAQPQQAYAQPQQPYAEVDPYDHTAEFDAQDIADNRLFAMLCYLFGFIGIIVAKLCAKESAYVQFHARQALKMSVINYILGFASLVLFWTFIVPIAACVCICIVSVLIIIAFVQVCKGQAKEPGIIRKFKF